MTTTRFTYSIGWGWSAKNSTLQAYYSNVDKLEVIEGRTDWFLFYQSREQQGKNPILGYQKKKENPSPYKFYGLRCSPEQEKLLLLRQRRSRDNKFGWWSKTWLWERPRWNFRIGYFGWCSRIARFLWWKSICPLWKSFEQVDFSQTCRSIQNRSASRQKNV